MNDIFELIEKEKKRQRDTIELIASENYVSKNILTALGSCLTNKYAEGYPGRRYYGGCQYVDEIESYCQKKWQEVFDTGYHVNVQPHSGTQANMAAFAACMDPGDTILSLSLNDGGHLSHGSPVNFSGITYNVIHYGIDENGYIDYDDLADKIRVYQPHVVLAGASAYSREIDFGRIRNIINKNSEFFMPWFMVDMAHIAGLVAAGVHQSPFGCADIITTTTHKTLRGPRGGLIFCDTMLAKRVDSAVFPNIQGGPHMHTIAAKAVCAEEACTDDYKHYIRSVITHAAMMAIEFKNLGYDVVSGGTDNHLFMLDLSNTLPHVTGKMAQDELDRYMITVNKNMVPGDKRKPSETSGIRIGTAAMTTRGWTSSNFIFCAREIDHILRKLEEKHKDDIS